MRTDETMPENGQSAQNDVVSACARAAAEAVLASLQERSCLFTVPVSYKAKYTDENGGGQKEWTEYIDSPVLDTKALKELTSSLKELAAILRGGDTDGNAESGGIILLPDRQTQEQP